MPSMKNELKEKTLQEIKTYAISHQIPIIHDETKLFLEKMITDNNFRDVLEIGTAIGYSALSMSNEKNNIQTIEREYPNVQLAKDFLKNISHEIEVIWSEAFFYQPQKKYDFIFIDASKVQYEKLFKKYQFFLKDNGVIVCDNLNFHNLDVNTISRSAKRIITKLNSFKTFLTENREFKTIFKDIGDGLSISWKKNFSPKII
ncbi:MAG: SAM-dependent methyltransferase [Candidatus Phytoplasma pruni]|uniref:O-methyltransferase n=1 Tax=Poinsettia branch-inducing phytoplasma TaxID=138647 RepID=UPI000375D716|nr:methyltransferase [Poinsettia branch-inducing phytoplasma]WEK82230.1 MAG: SAM-dependent methyltransferase [Candidatus Phytoplasma pruni]